MRAIAVVAGDTGAGDFLQGAPGALAVTLFSGLGEFTGGLVHAPADVAHLQGHESAGTEAGGAVGGLVALPTAAWLSAYPLDGYETTGIRRLRAYRMMQEGTMPGNVRLKPGAMMSRNAVTLRLKGVNDALDIPRDMKVDPALQARNRQ